MTANIDGIAGHDHRPHRQEAVPTRFANWWTKEIRAWFGQVDRKGVSRHRVKCLCGRDATRVAAKNHCEGGIRLHFPQGAWQLHDTVVCQKCVARLNKENRGCRSSIVWRPAEEFRMRAKRVIPIQRDAVYRTVDRDAFA